MAEPGQGLRFDVYERVQLPVDVADIRALEEIELTPHIGVYRENGLVVLRGHLLLAGLYEGESEEQEQRTLEHWIPVEITLPSGRVAERGDISVEIDNFDVDLLAPRTLNITGVLSLKGVDVRNETVQPVWEEEPFTFTHEPSGAADPYAGQEAQQLPHAPLYTVQPPAANGQSLPWNAYAVPIVQEEDQSPAGSGETGWDTQAGRFDADAAPETRPYVRLTDEDAGLREEREPFGQEGEAYAAAENYGQPADPDETETAEPEAYEEPKLQTTAEAATGTDLGQEQTGMKIGLSAQKSDTESPLGAAGLTTLLSKMRDGEPEPSASAFSPAEASIPAASVSVAPSQTPEARVPAASFAPPPESPASAAPARPVQEPQASKQSASDDIQWRNLFLRSREEDRDFRKVRMCIVQREDTLDAIAGRYRLNPRELQLYNRLEDDGVREGQVLYIP